MGYPSIMKYIIPSILAATILVASIFAMMPVQKASTIHSSVIQSTASADTQALTNTNIIADSALIKSGVVCVDLVAEAVDDNNEALRVEITTDGTEFVDLVADLDAATAPACFTFAGFRVFVAGTVVAGDTLSYTVAFRQT